MLLNRFAASSSGPAASIPRFANYFRNTCECLVGAVPNIRTSAAPIRALLFAGASKMLIIDQDSSSPSIPR